MNCDSLGEAVKRGDLDAVRSLVEKHGCDMNKANSGEWPWPPLVIAAIYGHLSVVEHLVEKGADIEKKDHDGWTPLMGAAMYGHLHILEYLVENGANLQSQNLDGVIPFFAAIQHGHLSAVEYLVDQRGVDVEAKDVHGMTPLICAVFIEQPTIVEYLVRRGADLEAKNNDGSTPLLSIMSPESDCLPVVKCLVENGANLNATNLKLLIDIWGDRQDGNNALMSLVDSQNCGSAIAYLCAQGIDVNVTNNRGCAAVHECWRASGMEYVAILLKYGADLSMATPDGVTASEMLAARFTDGNEAELMKAIRHTQLMIAVRAGDVMEVQRVLVEGGLNVNHDGTPLLIHAAQRNDLTMFECLVAHGVMIPSVVKMDMSTVAMLQQRQEWINQATALAYRRHVPLTAIRVIHEYVVGFNWSVVYEALSSP